MALSWNILNFVSSAEMYDGSLTYDWLSDGTKVSVRAEQDGHGGVSAGIKAVRAGDKVADIIKGADRASDTAKAIDKAKMASDAGMAAKSSAHSDDLKNVIYEVPGSATKDGKPYVGRTNDLSRRKHENRDGRDRTKAVIIGHYDPDVPKSGAIQEQKAINERGLDNLSNKRNEIKQSDWDRYGIQ